MLPRHCTAVEQGGYRRPGARRASTVCVAVAYIVSGSLVVAERHQQKPGCFVLCKLLHYTLQLGWAPGTRDDATEALGCAALLAAKGRNRGCAADSVAATAGFRGATTSNGSVQGADSRPVSIY